MAGKLLQIARFFMAGSLSTIVFIVWCAACVMCLLLIRFANRNFDTAADRARRQTHMGRRIIRWQEKTSLKLYQKKRLLKRLAMIFYMLALSVFAVNRAEYVRGFRVLVFEWTLEGATGQINILIRFAVEFLSFVPYGALIRWQHVRTHWKSILIQLSLSALVIETLQFLAMRGLVAPDDIVAYMLGGLLGVYLVRRSVHRRG